MSYARIDDNLALDPRWATVDRRSRVGLLGWMAAFHCHAQRHRTDGVLMRGGMHACMPGVGVPNGQTLAALVRCGMLAKLDDGRDGWQIVGYLDHNDPAEIRSGRARAKAQKRWEVARAASNAGSNASGNARGNAGAMLLPSYSEKESERLSPLISPLTAPPTGPAPGLSRDQLGGTKGGITDNGPGPAVITPEEAKARIAAVVQRLTEEA